MRGCRAPPPRSLRLLFLATYTAPSVRCHGAAHQRGAASGYLPRGAGSWRRTSAAACSNAARAGNSSVAVNSAESHCLPYLFSPAVPVHVSTNTGQQHSTVGRVSRSSRRGLLRRRTPQQDVFSPLRNRARWILGNLPS